MKFLALVSTMTLLAGSASAHGDHVGGSHPSLLHGLSDPLNWTLIALVFVLAYGTTRLSRGFGR